MMMQMLNICNNSFYDMAKSLITILFTLLMMAPVYAEDEIKSPERIPGAVKVNAEGVIELAESIPGLIIIDSRIRNDRLHGYIEGSLSLPDEETTCENLAKVIPNQKAPALYYCNGPKCGRSANAIEVALACGYKNVYWFRGGFEEWKAKNYPYVKD